MSLKFFKLITTVFLLTLFAYSQNYAQLSGPYTIPGTPFATVKQAVDSLNLVGVGAGGVTFNVTSGYTETAPAGGYLLGSTALNATTSVSNQLIFQKSGGGANPLITAFTPGTSTTVDGIWKIQGTDYVTIDGIDLQENSSNTTATQQMEWGYALVKLSNVTPFDGCQYVTIKNCTITLNKANTNSVGIYAGNHIATSTTSLTILATTDALNNCKFFGNTITNSYAGISLNGYSASSPYSLYDQNNEIGVTAGNTITNFGGSTVSARAIYGIYQNGLKVVGNNINSSVVGSTTTVYGVFLSTGTSSSADINNNTISISLATGTYTSTVYGINNAMGSTAASNTININNNIFQNCDFSGFSSGNWYAILNSGTATTVNINNNTVNNITMAGTGSSSYVIEMGSPVTGNMNGNSITNITRTGASGTQYGLKITSPTNLTANGNTLDGINYTNTTSTGSVYGFYGLTSAVNVTVTNNIFRNFSTPTTGTLYGIREFGVSGTKIFQNNQIYNFSTYTGGAGGASMYGIYCSTGNIDISSNLIYSLNSTGTTGGTGGTFAGIYISGGTTNNIYKNKIYDISTASTGPALYGIYIGGGTTNTIYNNLIGDLRTPAANLVNPLNGIYLSAGTTDNVYYNTVYLNATSTGALFGSSAVYASTTPTVNFIDNIFVNTSTPNGATGFSVAYRRSSTTLTTYGASSNNNDFYAGTPGVNNLIFYDGTNSDQTIAAFKTRVTPRDAASFTENPNFVSTVGSNANFLHINTGVATQLESGGIPITGITDDYDGNTRNATTPDVGADEFAGIALDLNPPIIAYTPLLNTSSTGSRTLTASINDPSGVPTGGIGLPRIAWKIGVSGSYNYVTGSYVSGSNYNFTFGSPVSTGDTVYYFVVAQDNAVTPNVGCFPSAGAGGFSANPPTAGTPPTTPSSYIISSAPLAGNYTVGLTEFNRVTGHNIYFQKVVTKVMKEVEVPVPVEEQKYEKGKEPLLNDTQTSLMPKTVKQMMEVEEISWVPMENGQPYFGDLYIKKAENSQFNYPENINGIYATITAAIADLNLRGVNGVTAFLLNDASYPTETYPLVVNVQNEGNLPTATNTVTIKPNTGVTALVQGTAASSQIFQVLNSYVNIDGSNSGGTDRSLTIQNLSTTTPRVIVIGSTGTTPITGCSLKNCIIINGANSSSAVVVSDGGTPGSAGYFTNITIQNNSVQLAYIGVYCNAVITSGNGNGLLLTQNDLTTSGANSIALTGLYVGGVDGATVSNNNVGNFTTAYTANITGIWFATGTINSTISNNTVGPINITTAPPRGIVVTSGLTNSNVTVSGNTVTGMKTTYSSPPYGIWVFSTTTGVVVEKNKVSSIWNTNTGGYGARGIHINTAVASTNITIRNNFVWDIEATSDASSTYWGIGIGIEGTTTGVDVYFNNVNLYGTMVGYTSATQSAAFAVITSTAAALDVRDNIFVNTFDNTNSATDKAYSINSQAPNTSYTNINYNDYYVSGTPGVLGYLGADQLTLAAWQTATGQDLQSISDNPHYVSDTDLHINTGYNVVSNNGQYLASVPTDIDGDARNVTTPDIGADEYIYVPPTVLDPTNVTASPISDTQINVGFTPNGNNNNVVIVFNLTGTFTAPSGAPPAPGNPFAGGTLIYNGLTSPLAHTGLTANTHYYYKLFSYDGSNYSSGVATDATTLCGAITSYPFTEGFEGATFAPDCWSNYGTKLWTHSSSGSHTGTYYAGVVYSPAGTANLQTPSFILPASPLYRIKFWWKDNDLFLAKGEKNKKDKEKYKGSDGVEIIGHDTTFFEITTNGGTTWTTLAFLSAASPQSSYTEVIQNLNAYAGMTVSFRWRDWSDGLSAAYGTHLDDITVEEIPACPDPTNLTATGITSSSANIGWSNATTVDIDYGAPGHPAGSGTVISGVVTNPYTLGGLTASTPYDVFVRQNCGSSFSSWVGPLSFTTLCDIVLAPWTQDFESGVFPPACWTVGGNIWLRGSASGYGTGLYSAKANFYGVSSGTDNLVSVGYNAGSLINPIVIFDWAYATYSGEVDEMDIYYSTDGGSTWTLLLAMPGGTNGILNPFHIVQTASFTPTAGQWSTMSLSLPAGSNMVRFTAITAFGNNLYLDNIKVEEAPSVPVFSISPTSKNYGTVYVGHSSADQTFTISNTGAGTLTIVSGGITLTGTDASQFVLTDANTYPINLTAGQSATVKVKFSPTSTGAKTANLQIVDNTTDATHLVPLSGTGATPPTVPFTVNFDAFISGQQVACQDSINWTTWDNLPCDAVQDAYISSTYAYSGLNSAKIVQNNDLVKPFATLTSGKWHITFMQYIPTGKAGYFNTLGLYAGGGSIWGLECYFDAGGAGRLFAGSATATNFTWVADSWKKVEVIVDLGADQAEFWYNNTMIKTWQWTLGASGTGCPLQLDANDFYGATANDEMYFDDYSLQPVTNNFQLTVNVNGGWNMVSVPGTNPDGMGVNTWWAYRDMSANVFKYSGGYQSVTTTTPGIGYWMKHTGPRTYNTGEEWPAGGIQIVAHDPIAGAAGWNLFGGYELSVSTSGLTTNPPGLITGSVYKYSGGYQQATTLDPGYGYWVKLTGAGQIIIPETLAKGEAAEFFKEDWGKIILTDAAGINYTLYEVKGEVDLSQYELPPAPPEGMFDIRFSSGRIAEDINSSVKTIDLSGVTYPLTVRAENMDIRLMDETGKLINLNLKKGEDVVISDATIQKLMVTGELIPDKYSLEQNYPNPFNPSTVIEFSLPENVSNVRLTIYSILGEKVTELVNTSLIAGKYSYTWNASSVATGMYIYELRTDKFVSVKKMLLLK